ncbi:hypothetical protein [Streptomyces sp. NBC_00316]|nr:hypothetical protein [Streptomyces sp. NBC_00316]
MSDVKDMSSSEHELHGDQNELEGSDDEDAEREEPSGYEPL